MDEEEHRSLAQPRPEAGREWSLGDCKLRGVNARAVCRLAQMRCDGCAWLRLEDLLHQPAALPHAARRPSSRAQLGEPIRQSRWPPSTEPRIRSGAAGGAARTCRGRPAGHRCSSYRPVAPTSSANLTSWARELGARGEPRASATRARTRTRRRLAARRSMLPHGQRLANASLQYPNAPADDVRIAITSEPSPQTILGVLAPSVANASLRAGGTRISFAPTRRPRRWRRRGRNRRGAPANRHGARAAAPTRSCTLRRLTSSSLRMIPSRRWRRRSRSACTSQSARTATPSATAE